MELKVNEVSIPEQITFNYDELKRDLIDKVSTYETLVYTDDQIKQAKADKANLNKLKKALNDERIRREKEYMKPFNDFKSKINEIICIIDKPVAVIDRQVKEYEDKKKTEKMEVIKEYWNNCDVHEGLSFEKIFDNKWLNASTSMKAIQDAINEAVEKFNNDMKVLADLPEYSFEAQQTYISTLDVGKALNEAHRLAEQAKRKAEDEARKVAEQMVTEKEFIPPVIDKKLDAEAFPSAQTVEQAVANESKKQWIAFQALLSTEDALALKGFFNSRNIEFKSI